MIARVLFVHGAGAAGTDAWLVQAAAAASGWTFLEREGHVDDAARDSHRICEVLRAEGVGHVVAHSYGANAALLAAQLEPTLVRSLALLEPACFDLARGRPVITGGSRPTYEETALSLTELGADHITLDGASHRIQDDPSVMSTLREHWRD